MKSGPLTRSRNLYEHRLISLGRVLESLAVVRPPLEPNEVAALRMDLDQLSRLVALVRNGAAPTSDADVALDVVTSRLEASLSIVAIRESIDLSQFPPTLSQSDDEDRSATDLIQVAARYGEDAKKEARRSAGLYAASLLMTVLAATAAWVGAERANESLSAPRTVLTTTTSPASPLNTAANPPPVPDAVRDESDNGFDLTHFLATLSVPLILFLSSVLLLRQAEVHRRHGAELARLQRQYEALEPYLTPLSTQEARFIRGLLAPQLFPRILEDDDPMRSTRWARPEDLIKILSEERAEAQTVRQQ